MTAESFFEGITSEKKNAKFTLLSVNQIFCWLQESQRLNLKEAEVIVDEMRKLMLKL